jgi:hypothetical protein
VTDEELQKTIEEMSREIKELSAPEKSLSPEEKKRGHLLLMKKDTLEKIQQARQSNNPSQEMRLSATYSLLCSFGEKHPLLLHFMRNKLRWNTF